MKLAKRLPIISLKDGDKLVVRGGGSNLYITKDYNE